VRARDGLLPGHVPSPPQGRPQGLPVAPRYRLESALVDAVPRVAESLARIAAALERLADQGDRR
jgi:hypothetical protein